AKPWQDEGVREPDPFFFWSAGEVRRERGPVQRASGAFGGRITPRRHAPVRVASTRRGNTELRIVPWTHRDFFPVYSAVVAAAGAFQVLRISSVWSRSR